MSSRIRVACIDGCHMVRQAFALALSHVPEIEVVGQAADVRSARHLLEALRPDVVLLDNALPDSDGVVATRRILERAAATKVVVMLSTTRRDQAIDLLAEGARGVVVKTQWWGDLVQALRQVASGDTYVAPELAHDVNVALAQRKKGGPHGPLGLLSAREREVFRLVMKGMTSEAIAQTLGIGVRTIDTHRAKIKRKLGLRSTTDVARIALHYGIITDC